MGKLLELIKSFLKSLAENELQNENDIEYQQALDLAKHGDSTGYYRLFLLNRGIEDKERTITEFSQDLLDKEKEYCLIGAKKGDKYAQCNLGLICMGDGDVTQAAIWMKKSAEQGLPWAQAMLGFFYVCGMGVLKNNSDAKKWLELASNQEEDYKAREGALEILNKLGENVH